MQEITSKYIKAFIASNKIALIATQPKLCIPIIFRMCQKMAHGVKFEEIKVCDSLIIDGHHRYLSSLIMKVELGKVASNSTSATTMIDWTLIEFEEEDWDTLAKIAYLNEQDAKYNDMQIDFVSRITQR